MKNIFALTKRNCLLFLRSKMTVFSSLLSSLILIALYFLFIAKSYASGFNQEAGLALTNKQLYFAIYSQMIVGVLVINSVSLSTGMFTLMARDLETRKSDAFMLTRVRSFELVISYLLSALLVSFLINLLMFIVSVIIIGASTYWISASTFFSVVGVLVIITIISCSIMLLITVLVKSSIAIGVINGIMGTILGFLCGIYMPYSQMGSVAKHIGSLLPFTHFTIWLKKIVLGDVFGQLGMNKELSDKMQELWFSAGEVGLCGAKVPLWAMILLSTIIAVFCLVISSFILTKRFGTNSNIAKIKHHKKSIKTAKN